MSRCRHQWITLVMERHTGWWARFWRVGCRPVYVVTEVACMKCKTVSSVQYPALRENPINYMTGATPTTNHGPKPEPRAADPNRIEPSVPWPERSA